MEHYNKKDKWLRTELLKGLDAIGVEVFLLEDPAPVFKEDAVHFKSTIIVKNKANNKEYTSTIDQIMRLNHGNSS